MNLLLILIGKLISTISRLLNAGSGSTWPGHIALSVNKNFIKNVLRNSKIKIILITGTNGKTTTGKLIHTILKKNGKKVFQNSAGANLLNGIASSLISNSNLQGKVDKDFAIFEIDENILPLILNEITNPDYVIILNLFRDQLDRYGEINTISKKWFDSLNKLDKETLILNGDDPQVTFLGWKSSSNVAYFGINSKDKTENVQYASDSTYCPNCGHKLVYSSVYFSHLGNWHCDNCDFKHPQKTLTSSPLYPLAGVYNEYNTNAAVLLAHEIGINEEKIVTSLKDFKPAFGRQEILNVYGKKVQIFLSKNPTSFNESLKTILNLKAKNLLLVLNDRIPDGRDVSWIWDVDFEEIIGLRKMKLFIGGDRVYDLALRLKYAEIPISERQINEKIKGAVDDALASSPKGEVLYVLPTYSAMLEVRKILTGRKIL